MNRIHCLKKHGYVTFKSLLNKLLIKILYNFLELIVIKNINSGQKYNKNIHSNIASFFCCCIGWKIRLLFRLHNRLPFRLAIVKVIVIAIKKKVNVKVIEITINNFTIAYLWFYCRYRHFYKNFLNEFFSDNFYINLLKYFYFFLFWINFWLVI